MKRKKKQGSSISRDSSGQPGLREALSQSAKLQEQLERERAKFEQERALLEQERDYDVAALARAQTKLEHSRDRYATLYDLAPVGFATLDLNGCIETINLTGAQLLGQNREDIRGRPLLVFLEKADRSRWMNELSVLRGGRLTESMVEVRLHRRGSERVVQLRITCRADQATDRTQLHVGLVDVTAQRKAEDALRESEEQFRRAIEEAPIPVIMHAEDGRVLQISRTWTELTGYRPQDMRTFNAWLNRAYGEGADAVRNHVQNLFKGKQQTIGIELPIRTRDGQTRHWSFSASAPGTLADGHRYVVGMAVDITEIKRAESSLRDAALFPAQDPAPILRISAQGRLLYANPASRELLQQWRCKVGSGVPPKVRTTAGLALASGNMREVQIRCRAREFSLLIAPINTLGYVNIYGFDVTERMRAEEALEQLNATLERRVAERTAELADANARHRAIADSALIGILTLDERGTIKSLNTAASQMFGSAPDKMVGRSINRLMASPHQMRGEKFLDHFLSHSLQPDNQGFNSAGTVVLGRRKKGPMMMLELTVSDFTHGGRREFALMVRDITERKLLERELLEISERERRRLGHDLHDGLGQHLHALYFMASLLEREAKDVSPKCAKEANRLTRQLEQALELSRSLARGLQPVNAVSEGLMIALRELAERTRELYRFDCQFQCPAPVFIQRHAAANHLFRIAQEAVNNAMKHGKPSRIRIKLAATPERIVLGVRDNGVGIRRAPGRAGGMGLHVMQYRADAIKGSLLVHRHPQGGTEVVCTVTRQALQSQKEPLK